MKSSPVHVVVGGGQIGQLTVELLAARGERVRQVYRRAKAERRDNVEVLPGDMTDPRFAETATQDATVVYDCSNPPYDRWPELLLPLGRGVLHAARKAGASVVALDNLYLYGRPSGPMRPDSPVQPCSRKGQLRAQLAEERLRAHERGEAPVTIVRASDFYGRGVTNALFGDHFFRRVLVGKSAQIFGDPDLPHSYTYGPDVAATLVSLGENERSRGKVWHVPTALAESTRQLVNRFAEELGRPIPLFVVPRLLLRAIGCFNGLMRENVEMLYQWEVPYVLDSSGTEEIFGLRSTPFATAIPVTLAWARQHYPAP